MKDLKYSEDQSWVKTDIFVATKTDFHQREYEKRFHWELASLLTVFIQSIQRACLHYRLLRHRLLTLILSNN